MKAAVDEFRRPDGQFGEQHHPEASNFTPPDTDTATALRTPCRPDADPEVLDHYEWFDPSDGGAAVTHLALSRTTEGNVAVDLDIEEGLDWHTRLHFDCLTDVDLSEPAPGTDVTKEEALNVWIEQHGPAIAANLADLYGAWVTVEGEGEDQRVRMEFRIDTGKPAATSMDVANTAIDKWAHVTNTTDPGTYGSQYLFGEAFSQLNGQAVLGGRYGIAESGDQVVGKQLEADAVTAAGELVGTRGNDDFPLLTALANRTREGINLDALRTELVRGQDEVGLADRFGRVAEWVRHRDATRDADRPW